MQVVYFHRQSAFAAKSSLSILGVSSSAWSIFLQVGNGLRPANMAQRASGS
jgi:hypothetical protein